MLRRHSQLAVAQTIHFVTTVTRIRGPWFVEPERCEALLGIFEHYREANHLNCIGYVVMPDHVHLLLHQAEDGPFISQCLLQFKKVTSVRLKIPDFHGVRLWRDGYDDVLVPGASAIQTKLNYLHRNPVRRGLAEEPQEYVWSSARAYYQGMEDSIVKLTKFIHW